MSVISKSQDQDLEEYRPPRWWFWDEDDLVSPWASRSIQGYVKQDYTRAPHASLKETGAHVHMDENKFQVSVDVQHFAPHELRVKAAGDDTIIVEGRHKDKPGDTGFISRRFMRRYVLPKGHDMNQAESSLSSDGILSVTVPRTGLEHRLIPIVHTGMPSKGIFEENSEN